MSWEARHKLAQLRGGRAGMVKVSKFSIHWSASERNCSGADAQVISLSLLSCHLSSFCWAVNCLPYLWTRSGIVFCPRSSRPRSPLRWHHEWHVSNVYFNRKPITDIHTSTTPDYDPTSAHCACMIMNLTLRRLALSNLIHRLEEGLNLKSECIVVSAMVHLPQEWNFGFPKSMGKWC